MKDRRHSNTRGQRQIKSGASFRRLVKFAKKRGLKVNGAKEVEQLEERSETNVLERNPD